MTKDYFFKINDEYIYLDIELINFNDIPVFFICKSNKNYYLALYFDVFDEKYIVIQVKRSLLLKMLDQKITMREIYHTVDSFWEIVYGETPEQDVVKEKAINDIDESVLPIEGEVYEVFDDDVKEYREQLLTDIFATISYHPLQNQPLQKVYGTVDSFLKAIYGDTPEQDSADEKSIKVIEGSALSIESEVNKAFDDNVREDKERIITNSFVTSLYRPLNICSVTISSELRPSKTDVDDYDERFNGYSSIIYGCDVPVTVKPKKEIINQEIDISNKEFEVFIEKGSDAA